MKKNKKFDCVQMKWNIQRKMREESAGLSDRDAHNIQMAKVVKDPVLGPFSKKLRSVKHASRK